MKKHVFLTGLAVLAVLVFSSCNNLPSASSKPIDKTYDLSGFDKVKAGSVFNVYVGYGEEFFVRITVNEDQIDWIDVAVEDETLVFSYDSPTDYSGLSFTAEVILPEINRVTLRDKAVVFFYDLRAGASSRSLWDSSFAVPGKTLELLLEGEYSHASFDTYVPPLPNGLFYLYTRSNYSAFNRDHTVDAKEIVIHSLSDTSSSRIKIRKNRIEPDLLIVQGDRYGTLDLKDLKAKEAFVQLDYYKNAAYINTPRFVGSNDRIKALREQYDLTEGGSHSQTSSYVSSFSSLYYNSMYGSGSVSAVRQLSSSSIITTY